jgi:glycosyltransferase involved in cell wall biosynthesis
VQLAGAVPDLRPFYQEADVVVVPLLHGGGTRIKVLEAFAYRRPVVATSVAVAGLALRDGVEVMLADSPREFAAAVSALLEDAASGLRLVESADRLLTARYTRDVVAPRVLDLVGAAGSSSSSVTTGPEPTPR